MDVAIPVITLALIVAVVVTRPRRSGALTISTTSRKTTRTTTKSTNTQTPTGWRTSRPTRAA